MFKPEAIGWYDFLEDFRALLPEWSEKMLQPDLLRVGIRQKPGRL
jgi:hypothetical protein